MGERARTMLVVATGAVVGVPLLFVLAVLLVFAPSSGASSSCASPVSGSASASAAGVPAQYVPFYVQAAAAFDLGADGWAYLAAIHQAETNFGTYDPPRSGVLSGSNYAGAAGPMQIGIGGRAGDNWDTVLAMIPASLAGGVDPPSVYNSADAIYGAAALLRRWGAPADWQAALRAWNDYPPEIAQINSDVAAYTARATGVQDVSLTTVSASSGCGALGGGPTVPGAAARIDPQTGLASIPLSAPAAVQRIIAAGNQIIDKPYVWGGGHAAFTSGGYDCSGAVSYVLHAAGALSSPLDSTALESFGAPDAGRWVTVFAGTSGGEGHTFVAIAGIVLDTVHGTPTEPPGTGPRWQTLAELQFELATGSFVQRHPPGL